MTLLKLPRISIQGKIYGAIREERANSDGLLASRCASVSPSKCSITRKSVQKELATANENVTAVVRHRDREREGIDRDKNVIVLCSYPFKTGTNESNRQRCIWLRSIVESKIFKTRPITPVVSGTRGRRFKSSQARHFSLLISTRSRWVRGRHRTG
jgi:hypothetical protein